MKKITLFALLISLNIRAIEPISTAAIGAAVFFFAKKLVNGFRTAVAPSIEQRANFVEQKIATIEIPMQNESVVLKPQAKEKVVLQTELESAINKKSFCDLRNKIMILLMEHADCPKNELGMPVAIVDQLQQLRSMVNNNEYENFVKIIRDILQQRKTAHA